MPTTQPNAANRTAEAAALTLLLATPRARYSLPSLIAQRKIKARAFRRISPTNSIASDLAAPHFAVASAWAAEIPSILDAVPFGQSAVANALNQAASRLGITVSQARARFPQIVSRIEQWHRSQWTQRIKTATTLDVSMLTSAQDVADATSATIQWNQALADDVHSQIKARLVAALLVGGVSVAGAKAQAADVIAKARRRAAGIGTDQAEKISAGMTRDRAKAAGLDSWLWLHQDQKHPRPEHVVRNGNIYTSETAPDDMPGTLPNCKCTQLPLWN